MSSTLPEGVNATRDLDEPAHLSGVKVLEDLGERRLGGRLIDRAMLSKEVRQLSQLRPIVPLRLLAYEYILVAAIIAMTVFLGAWYLYPLAIVLVAGRQTAISVLFHEAAHYRMVRSKRWNTVLGAALAALPLNLSLLVFRDRHFRHHRYLNTSNDPDYVESLRTIEFKWPKPRWLAICLLLADAVGLNAPRNIAYSFRFTPFFGLINAVRGRMQTPVWAHATEATAHLCFLGVQATFAWWFGFFGNWLLLWIVPQLTVFWAIMRLRTAGEHACCEGSNELNSSRHVIARLWERVFISPYNIHYHLEHHLFPSVPFYNLPKLHHLLRGLPEFQEHAHVTHGYLGDRSVLWECTRDKRRGVIASNSTGMQVRHPPAN